MKNAVSHVFINCTCIQHFQVQQHSIFLFCVTESSGVLHILIVTGGSGVLVQVLQDFLRITSFAFQFNRKTRNSLSNCK